MPASSFSPDVYLWNDKTKYNEKRDMYKQHQPQNVCMYQPKRFHSFHIALLGGLFPYELFAARTLQYCEQKIGILELKI